MRRTSLVSILVVHAAWCMAQNTGSGNTEALAP